MKEGYIAIALKLIYASVECIHEMMAGAEYAEVFKPFGLAIFIRYKSDDSIGLDKMIH